LANIKGLRRPNTGLVISSGSEGDGEDEDDGKQDEEYRNPPDSHLDSEEEEEVQLGNQGSITRDVRGIIPVAVREGGSVGVEDSHAIIDVPTNVFDNKYILEDASDSGKKGWTCLHCNKYFKVKNVTKVKCHLACKTGPGVDIAPCVFRNQPSNYADMYHRQYENYLKKRMDRKASKAIALERSEQVADVNLQKILEQSNTKNARALRKFLTLANSRTHLLVLRSYLRVRQG
jgi:hypothetical protein